MSLKPSAPGSSNGGSSIGSGSGMVTTGGGGAGTTTTGPTMKMVAVASPTPATVAAPKCPVSYAFPVLLSSFLLAMVAGYINVFFLESLFGTSVSHLTGTTTRAAAQFAAGSYELLFRNLGIVFFFFVGSSLNAFIVGDSQMKMVQNYCFAIMLESLLIVTPVFIPTTSRFNMNTSIYIIACACGLQNAMLTVFGTAIVRTTHVTGLVTDVGILVGLYLRDLVIEHKVRKEGMWKLKIMIPLYLGFFMGGSFGWLAMTRITGTYPLIIPSVVTAWIGLGFLVLRHVHNKQEAFKALMEQKRLEQQRIEERELQEEMQEYMQEAGIEREPTSDEIPQRQGSQDSSRILYTSSQQVLLSPVKEED